jgi:hypothetical protein
MNHLDKYQELSYHPTMERLVDILRKKTQNQNPMFFRLVVSYFFAKVASMMRAHVVLADDQVIPVNMYAINLAPSGSGKGHSINIMEDNVIAGFRKRFLEDTFRNKADASLKKIAVRRAQRDQEDPEEVLTRTRLEFEEQGVLLFSFDSGTSAAIKQMRTKLLMAQAGSMNLEMDEIGSNFTGNTELLNAYLELFDTGKIKQKLIKNTRDNVRSEDLFGATPTNMLLFGTPVKLLNGARTEDEFFDFLEIGYARRCFFAYSRFRHAQKNQTAQDMYNIYHDPKSNAYLTQINDKLTQLADPSMFHQKIKFRQDTLLKLYDYRIACQTESDKLPEFNEVQRSEMAHRYFKVAKLAAVYAFIDKNTYITDDNLDNAIAMAEYSGNAFQELLNRDRPPVKLANYICTSGKELTQPDLIEDLPFYKGTEAARREMMTLAIAHGYKNGMYIKTEVVDGIQFFSGKKVEETNLSKMTGAVSTRITEDYNKFEAPFDKMWKMVTKAGYHWVNHDLRQGYRDEAHVIPGCNMIVLDVEGSVDIPTAQLLLKDFTYLIHTTKRHTDKNHRFRIIMPLSHEVELDAKEYREFMKNIYDWLPFEVDTATQDRCRKWLTCNGKHWYNTGELLDALQFVPKTKKAEDRKKWLASQTNLSALERWALGQVEDGNRNHTLARHAFTLVEMGYSLDDITTKVMDLNSKFDDPLDESEIHRTILVTVNKRITQRNSE